MIFYRLAYFIIFLLAKLGAVFSPKLRQALDGKKGLLNRLSHHTSNWDHPPFWFHIASSGELEQCLPVMEQLKKNHPEVPIFLSYFSPSGRRGVELEINRSSSVPWDYSDYSPFDFKRHINRILDVLNPRQLIMVDRELWPELIHCCWQRNIPCHLMATSLSDLSDKKILFYRWTLRKLSSVGTIDEPSAHKLLEVLPKSVRIDVMGDPRVERVLHRRNRAKTLHWAPRFDGIPVAVMASIWPADFKNLEPSLDWLLTKHPNWKLVLVPHEPKAPFINELSRWCQEKSHVTQLWRQWVHTPSEAQVLIVDEVGYLAELYQIADLVFVGGSFVSDVHNVLEPAAWGCPILTGPFIKNAVEATQMAEFGLIRAENDQQLLLAFKTLVNEESERANRAAWLGNYLKEASGATKRYVELYDRP